MYISERRGIWRWKREKYIGKVRAREREVSAMKAWRKSEEHRKNRKETYKSMNVHKNIRESTPREKQHVCERQCM